jgi:hypothetical protein
LSYEVIWRFQIAFLYSRKLISKGVSYCKIMMVDEILSIIFVMIKIAMKQSFNIVLGWIDPSFSEGNDEWSLFTVRTNGADQCCQPCGCSLRTLFSKFRVGNTGADWPDADSDLTFCGWLNFALGWGGVLFSIIVQF